MAIFRILNHLRLSFEFTLHMPCSLSPMVHGLRWNIIFVLSDTNNIRRNIIAASPLAPLTLYIVELLSSLDKLGSNICRLVYIAPAVDSDAVFYISLWRFYLLSWVSHCERHRLLPLQAECLYIFWRLMRPLDLVKEPRNPLWKIRIAYLGVHTRVFFTE